MRFADNVNIRQKDGAGWRTNMKSIDKLTKEQEARIPEWVNKWIEIGLKTGDLDLPRFERGMKVAYEKAKLKWHGNIVVVPNPLIGALASPIAG